MEIESTIHNLFAEFLRGYDESQTSNASSCCLSVFVHCKYIESAFPSPGVRPCRGRGGPWARRPPGGPQPPSPSARGPSSLVILLLHPLMRTPFGPRTRRPTKLWQVRSENFVTLCLFCSGGRAPLISQLSILMIILFQTQKFREPLIWGGSTLREAWKTPCRSLD